ncbi:armadillo-type protein [Xylaria bambusicola]|uniref:armadillo-type protein n=1 Tax=Xylaria bambusicola TaxID=326684 RepID=UPI002008E276|nr:armadillo-type protein [Xylaria bambusicola]KAI0509733.1 armadillo-type protein [Xylaria bambusicola]
MSGSSIDQLLSTLPKDEAQQTKVLGQVVDIAQNLWKKDPGSPELDVLAQKVGDAARVEANRTPLGESGLLEFFCSVVSTQGLRSTLVVQCLRVIGNSSADTDENRAKVVDSGCLPSIVLLLNDDSMLPFVVPVLFNISVDYEPAQKAIYQAGINPELVSLISGLRRENAAPLMSYICKLLGFVATQEPQANLVHPATPFILLHLANDQPSPVDAEEFLGQASVALTYLSQEQYQRSFLETAASIILLLNAFFMACESIDVSEEGPDGEAQLNQVQTAFTATLADLSAQPLFASSCSLDGHEVQTLQDWISSAHIQLRSAACLALGNIARSDEKCIYLVQKRNIHMPLITILSDPSNVDAGLLHSILSFLKNLAIPADNKAILGSTGLLDPEVLPRIWDLDTQTQVQFDAVSLTRLLLVNCPANVHRIIKQDPSTQRSKLHSLIDLNKRSDQEPTQMESARAIATICRILHSSTPTSFSSSGTNQDSQPDSPPSLTTFYSAHTTLTDAMLRLGEQTKFPALRSELLFVFALMARTPEGSAAVAQTTHRSELFSLIVETITGSPTTTTANTPSLPPQLPSAASASAEITKLANLPAQAPAPTKSTRDVDRENALVLVAELLQHCPGELSDNARGTFENLLREGGQRLLRERDEGRNE